MQYEDVSETSPCEWMLKMQIDCLSAFPSQPPLDFVLNSIWLRLMWFCPNLTILQNTWNHVHGISIKPAAFLPMLLFASQSFTLWIKFKFSVNNWFISKSYCDLVFLNLIIYPKHFRLWSNFLKRSIEIHWDLHISIRLAFRLFL